MVKIDVHMHLVGVGCCQSGCLVAPSFQKRYTFRILKRFLGITSEQMASTLDEDWVIRISKMLDASELDYGVVLGFDGVYDKSTGQHSTAESQMVVPDDWVFNVCQRFPNLLPGPSINPLAHNALERLESAVTKGAVLIKWLPVVQDIDLSIPKLREFYQLAAQHKIPLLIHMGGERTFQSISPHLADARLLTYPLDAGATVICAHSATKILGSSEPDQTKTVIELCQKYPNLWLDNSALCNPARFQHLFHITKYPLILERTLYGSDWPVPSNAIYFIKQLGLKKCWQLEREKNPLTRDITLKRLAGYPEHTLIQASLVLANLKKWIKISNI